MRVQLLELVDKQENEVEAETYVWSGLDDDLEKSEWDFEEFRREKMFRWVGGSKEYEGELRPSITGSCLELAS